MVRKLPAYMTEVLLGKGVKMKQTNAFNMDFERILALFENSMIHDYYNI
jgi:hypothetical protein